MDIRTIVIGSGCIGAIACGSQSDIDPGRHGTATQALSSCTGAWEQVDTPNAESGDNTLASVSGSSQDDVWAVGQFAPDANPNITLTLAEHYDGSKWSVVDTPNIGTHANALLAVAAVTGRAWAVGYHIGEAFLARSLIEAWDGTAWQVVDHPRPFDTENLYGVSAMSSTDVWAVGSGRNGEGQFHMIALHFDGRRWSLVPTADPGSNGNVLYGVSALAKDDVWAVGQKIGSEAPDESLVEHWDGVSWSVVATAPSGIASTQFLAIAGGREMRVAVGDAQDGAVSLRTLAERGSQQAFSLFATANPSGGDNRLAGVALGNDREAWAVGNYLDVSSGNQLTLIERSHDGSAFAQVQSPSPSTDGNNQLAAVTRVGDGNLWAVGAFDGPDSAQTMALHRCNP